jgi:anti-sigma factor RsiW
MNADKAKEFFSAYHEGTLDRGLRESFERKLNSDPKVRAEYSAFQETMQKLQGLAAPVPDPDFDLNERIAARLDRYIYETKPKPAAAFFSRRRTVVVVGLCLLAIVGAATQLGPGGSFRHMLAGFIGHGSSVTIPDKLSVTIQNGVPTLTFATGGAKVVVLRDAETGKRLLVESLDGSQNARGDTMRSPLLYASTDPKLIDVQVSDSRVRACIALPGSDSVLPSSGHGTLRDLARTLADHYHLVVVDEASGTQTVTWDLKDDAVASATEALKGTSRTVQRSAGVIWIQ